MNEVPHVARSHAGLRAGDWEATWNVLRLAPFGLATNHSGHCLALKDAGPWCRAGGRWGSSLHNKETLLAPVEMY